jgi:hypothetical protein
MVTVRGNNPTNIQLLLPLNDKWKRFNTFLCCLNNRNINSWGTVKQKKYFEKPQQIT